MKFTVSRHALSGAIDRARRALPSRTPLPILGNLLLSVSGGILTITGTDMDLQISTSVPVTGATGDGAITVPGTILCNIVSKLPTEEVGIAFEMDKVAVTVTSGKSRFLILGLKAEEFPVDLFSYDDAQVIELSQVALRTSIRDTQYAISADQNRYLLTGLLLEWEAGNINVVATDGHRLAKAVLDGGFQQIPETIIPHKAVSELSAILAQGADEPVTVTISEKAIRFSLGDGGVVVESKVIEGKYPNYRQVVPGPPNYTVTVRLGDLADMVSRVRSLKPDVQSVVLEFTENLLSCSINAPNIGEGTDSIDVAFTGEPLTVALDPSYMIDTLRTIPKEESVDMMIIGGVSPVSFKSDNFSYHFIMPMRILK